MTWPYLPLRERHRLTPVRRRRPPHLVHVCRSCGRWCIGIAGAAVLQTMLFPLEHYVWATWLGPLLGVSF